MKKGQEVTFANLTAPIELKQLNDVINYMLSFINGFNSTYFDSMLSKSDLFKNAEGKLGTVLYQSEQTNGIYCDGNTTATTKNSVTFADSSPSGALYKRLGIYVRTPFGLACMEMPIDRTQSYNHPTYGYYQGGIIFPTGDSSSGATKNYLVKLNWCAVHSDSQWTFQVTDTGWVNLGTEYVSVSDYKNNTDVALTSDTVTWNQRHSIYYSVYKIVGYTE